MAYRPTRGFLAAEKSNTWRFDDFPPETTVADLLNPETWAHSARQFARRDEIVIVPQGEPFRAHLFVMEAGKNFAKVRLLDVTVLNDAEAAAAPKADPLPEGLPADAPLEIKWNPGRKLYAIHRKGGDRIHDGFAIKAEAVDWAIRHIASMAA